jgi:hypothetical protein
MKQHHSAELESWVFHSLVRNHSNELRTCVHRLTSHLFKQTMTSRPQIRRGVFGGGGGKRVINWHERLLYVFQSTPRRKRGIKGEMPWLYTMLQPQVTPPT